MFLLLTQILLWLLIGIFIWYLLRTLIPRSVLVWISGGLILLVLAFAFAGTQSGLIADAWRILSLPLKPLGLAIILLAGGVSSLNKWGGVKYGKEQITAAFLILLLSSLPIAANWLAQQAERAASQTSTRFGICQGFCPDQQTTPAATATADAIVVIGRGRSQVYMPYQSTDQPAYTDDRLVAAANLYRQGRSSRILVGAEPQVDTQNQGASVETSNIRTQLERLGVPPAAVTIEDKGADIQTTATSVRERIGAGKRVIIVAPALSVYRAVRTFENQDIRVVRAEPTGFITYRPDNRKPRPLIRAAADLVPSVEALSTTTRVVEEYLASIYYFLRGWLAPLGL